MRSNIKQAFFTVLLIFGASPITLYSNNSSATLNGATDLKNQTFQQLTINGAATLTNINAQQTITRGSLKAERCTFDIATLKGAVTCKKCTITQQLTINGASTISLSKLNNLTINGSLHLNDTLVIGTTIVNGASRIAHCQIHKFITTSTETDIIDSTITGSIVIKKPGSFWSFITWVKSFFNDQQKQQIKLVNSTVYGNITFEEPDGHVILQGNSKIVGTLLNGTQIIH